jgi:fibronectin type 3 domain-containing protein
MSIATRRRVRIRAGVVVTLVLALATVLLTAEAAAAGTCQTSGPVGGTYTVNVCLTAPSDGATVGGATIVTATVSVTGTSPGTQRLVFRYTPPGGGPTYLLTDYQSPYTFVLPTTKFVDGSYGLSAEALMRDTFTTAQTSIGLTFANGITTPPVNTNSWSPTSGAALAPGRTYTVAAAGDGAGGDASETAVGNLIAGWNPNMFLYLGDVYEKGSPTEFTNWYGFPVPGNTFYGRFRDITNPTIGNHEYTAGQAPGYFDYWDNAPHYYSFNTHGWHVVSIDANTAFNQFGPTSAQYQWLLNDLSSNSQPCTMAFWHQPLYNIGDEGATTALAPIWSLLASHGADLVVNGHDHTYQRWQPLDGAGNPSASGVTEIIAGAGGHALGEFPSSDSRVAFQAAQFGALKLGLNAAGAAYQFTTVNGTTLDSGSVQCDPTTTDNANPSAPATLTATAPYKSRIELAWDESTDNVGVTGYRVYRDDLPLTTVGAQTTFSDKTVDPGSTHTYRVTALDAAGNESALSPPASATTPLISVLFHDGFESGDLSGWTNPAGGTIPSNVGLVASTDPVFDGQYAARSTAGPAQGAAAWKSLAEPATDLYYRAKLYVASHNSTVTLLRFRRGNAGSSPIATLGLATTNKLTLRNDGGAVPTTTTSAVSASGGAWHTVQVHVHVDPTTGSAGSTEVWLDGAAVNDLTSTGVDLGTPPVAKVELGDPGSATSTRSWDVSFDEVAFDTSFIGDVTAPTEATGLTATAHSGLRVDLSWAAATDDTGVTGYDIYRNGALITTTPPTTTYQDLTVSPLTSYTYRLVARDGANNSSPFSNAAFTQTGEIFTDGFESGDLVKWSPAGLTTTQDFVDTGSWAARARDLGGSGSSAQTVLDRNVDDLYYRTRFRIESQGANPVGLMRLRTAANGALASAFVSSVGKVGFRNDVTAASTTSTQTVSSGTWHTLQLHGTIAGDASQVELQLDGVTVISTTTSLGTTGIGRLEIGDPSDLRTFDVAFDGVVASNTSVVDSGPPTAPGNVHTTGVTAHQVDLAWDPAEDDVGVSAYRVYRDGLPLQTIDGSLTAYADATAAESTNYAYFVIALDAVGHESSASNIVHVMTTDGTKPTVPANVAAAAVAGQNKVVVTWNAATDNVGVVGYRVYRADQVDPIGSVNGSTLTYDDTTVASATSYTYRVTALDAAGNESDPSSPATVTSADTTAPQAPASVTAVGVSDTGVDLTWPAGSDNVGVTGYRVFRGGTQIASVGAVLSYSDTTAPTDATSSYTVRSVDGAGNVSTTASAPGTAKTFVFTDGFETGNLSRWTTNNGVFAQDLYKTTGVFGAEAKSTKNTAQWASKTLPRTHTDLTYRLRLQLLVGKKDTVDVMRIQTATGTDLLSLLYDGNRRLGLRNDVTNQTVISTTAITNGSWYDVRVHVVVNGTASTIEVFLNGVKITALSPPTASLGTSPVGRVLIGENVSGHAYDLAFDDVVVTSTNP